MISVAWPLMMAEPRTPGPVSADLDVERVVDDIDDLVDHQAHRPAFVGEDQQRLRALALHRHVVIDWDERHELAAVLHQVAAVGEFDTADVDFLQPGDERERHCLGLRRARAEHQHGNGLFGVRGRLRLRLIADLAAGARRSAERLGKSVGIDNQDHRAVAENGIAGEQADVTQHGRHRLDHDFFGMEHAVDDDAEGFAADLRHDDETVFRAVRLPLIEVEQTAQVRQREQLVA